MITIDEALRIAMQLQNEGKLAQAETILNQILNQNPSHAEALHLLGVIAYQVGKIPLAVQLIQKAIDAHPTVALFHSNLGEMHRKLKTFDLSIQSGQRAVTLDPESASAWSNLGVAYYDIKQYEQAELCHQKALGINPHLGYSLNNMGSIYKEKDDKEKAKAFYLSAITAMPHLIEPYNNLGVLLLEQYEFNQAFEYLSCAINIAPTFPDAHCNLGLALIGLEHYDSALLHFEKTLQLNPNSAEAYYGLAKVNLHKQDFIEAEKHIRQAMVLHPEKAEFYQLFGIIYSEQGNHTQALFYLNQALSIDPTLASLYVSKGTVLTEMGEIAKAKEQFLSIAEHPSIDTRVWAYYSLAQLSKVKPNNIGFKELLALANNIQEVSRKEYVYFALGKCFDDLGEWAKAFEYFRQGCTIKRKQITYNIQEQIQFTQQIIRCFTKDTIEYLRAFAHPSAVPIFIVGMPRSGSTLVEQILSSHPSVYGAGELKYFTDLIQWPVENHASALRYPENIYHLSPFIYRTIIEKYLNYIQRFSSKALHITDKMLHNYIVVGVIHALLPNAKIIHVKRNPMDTCLSCYSKLFNQGQLYSYDLTELGQYYHCYELIMNHWRAILPEHSWLDIQYEDIVHNLEKEAKQLLSFCDLKWDPACLAFYESKRSVRTASVIQVRQTLYASSVERWRRFEQELAPLANTLNSFMLYI